MRSIFYIQIFLGLIFLFGFYYPGEMLTVIRKIKRQLHQTIVQREGQRVWQQLEGKFRKKSENAGYSSRLVDEILEEYREKIILQIGNKKVDEVLGS